MLLLILFNNSHRSHTTSSQHKTQPKDRLHPQKTRIVSVAAAGNHRVRSEPVLTEDPIECHANSTEEEKSLPPQSLYLSPVLLGSHGFRGYFYAELLNSLLAIYHT